MIGTGFNLAEIGQVRFLLYICKMKKTITAYILLSIIAIILILLLSSCTTRKCNCSGGYAGGRDSTYTKIHDSLVYIHGGRESFTIHNPCDSAGKIRYINNSQSNGNGHLSVKKVGNDLVINSNCDSLSFVVQEKEKTIAYLKNTVRTVQLPPPVPTFWEELGTKIVQFFAIIGGLATILVVLKFVFKL